MPIVVAINKIDRANADPNRVMQQLSEHDLVPEQWGGDTVMIEVSALQNLGIDDLLANLLVVAEVEDLRAQPDGRGAGRRCSSRTSTWAGARWPPCSSSGARSRSATRWWPARPGAGSGR